MWYGGKDGEDREEECEKGMGICEGKWRVERCEV